MGRCGGLLSRLGLSSGLLDALGGSRGSWLGLRLRGGHLVDRHVGKLCEGYGRVLRRIGCLITAPSCWEPVWVSSEVLELLVRPSAAEKAAPVGAERAA